MIIVFIGGFLFHTIWEAKCQYTITYFILLIPYSVKGYDCLTNKIINYIKNSIKKRLWILYTKYITVKYDNIVIRIDGENMKKLNNKGFEMDNMIAVMIAFALVLIVLVVLTYVINPI